MSPLRDHAETDYPADVKGTGKMLAELALERDDFHGEWNYRLKPRQIQS
ncbi:MAG: hypothetical protein VBE63_00525 [Lamprobacter sp.]|nr:hypothetical protein [Lamprobacter sp.]MEA3638409.1 hypothetical protein [Lamprobacter sp.]